MAAKIEAIRELMRVGVTRDDKGLILELKIRAYDNGLLYVDERPMGGQTEGWLACNEVLAMMLTELFRQHRDRQTQEE